MSIRGDRPFLGEQPALSTERTSGVIVRLIRDAIVQGRLQPGETLVEVELAREHGTSRPPVREALIQLRQEGLVEGGANRPAAVRSYTAAELHDIYGIRAALEGFAASRAAIRGGAPLARELDASNDRFHALAVQEGDVVDALVRENLTFHGLIAEGAGIPRLGEMIDQVMAIPRRYRAYAAYTVEARVTVEADHRAITEAIRDENETAAQNLITEHVLWTGRVAVGAQAFGSPDSESA